MLECAVFCYLNPTLTPINGCMQRSDTVQIMFQDYSCYHLEGEWEEGKTGKRGPGKAQDIVWRYPAARGTLRAQTDFKYYSNKRNPGSFQKRPIPGLGQEMCQTSLAHLLVPGSKEVLKK